MNRKRNTLFLVLLTAIILGATFLAQAQKNDSRGREAAFWQERERVTVNRESDLLNPRNSAVSNEALTKDQATAASVNAIGPGLKAIDPRVVPEIPQPQDLPPAFASPQPISNITDENPLILPDCYALALKQSEQIAIDGESIRIAEAHFLQSFGTLLPQVSFSWTDTRQNANTGLNSTGRTERIESRFIFKQTLFSGFKEFAGMSGSRLEKDQYLQQKKRAAQMLFVDVADAFYLLLEQQEDVKVLETIHAALVDRITELKKREDIGRTRHSEVVNTETQLYNLEAEIDLSKSQEVIARDLLEFLIGQPLVQIRDPQDVPDSLAEEANYLAKSDSRPDVQAARYAWEVAKKKSALARSDLFPTVSVEGNTFPHRNDLPSDQSWSSVLRVDVPIFEGTTTYGLIKEANAQAKQMDLQFRRTQRLAFQDIQDSYVRAMTAITRTRVLDKALKTAELNYSLQAQDYRYSLVSNLDVLAAIQTLGNTKRNYIQTYYEKKRFYWQLQAAIGAVGEDN